MDDKDERQITNGRYIMVIVKKQTVNKQQKEIN